MPRFWILKMVNRRQMMLLETVEAENAPAAKLRSEYFNNPDVFVRVEGDNGVAGLITKDSA